MSIHEKLERLTDMMHRAAVSRRAGFCDGYLSGLLSKRHNVSLRTANAFARALGVDVGWLVDDSRGWPPVRTNELVTASDER